MPPTPSGSRRGPSGCARIEAEQLLDAPVTPEEKAALDAMPSDSERTLKGRAREGR
jgi:hypothetical protein